ncbi:MAG: L,D-transpeptidase family protein, partial [Thermomicrobiales bacterium]
PPVRSRRAPRRRGGRIPAFAVVLAAVAVLGIVGIALLASGRVPLSGVWSNDGIPFLDRTRPVSDSWTADVATDALNVRDSASLEADVIGSLAFGQRVTVTGDNTDGFVPIVASVGGVDLTGWAAVAYLQPVDGSVWAIDPDHGAALDGGVSVGETTDAPAPADPGSDASAAVVAEPTSEPTPPPVPTDVPTVAATGERWIDVDRSTATVTLYTGETAVSQFPALIGRDPAPDGFYSTAVGTFHVYSMDAALSSTPFVDDVYLTDWVGFDPVRKNGFHSPVRNADGSVRVTGGTVTMGCVRLGEDDARTLYAFAEIGMRVEIHD